MAKSNTKAFTTSELAKEFDISVVSASRFIVKHNFRPIKTGKHNAKYYDENVYQQMKEHYENKPKTNVKHYHTVTKDDIIEQLQSQIKQQSMTIKFLKHQISIKDEQITAANQIANQAQQLDLTTHKQQNTLPDTIKTNDNHSWLWKLFH